MARNNQRGGSSTRRAPKDLGRRVKKKPCALCRDKVDWVDYKDVPMLRKYMSDRGKIRSRRVTGNCAQHQRALAQAIKTARELVLLPYTQRTVTERPGGRRDRGDRGDRVLGEGFAGAAPAPVAVEVVDDTEPGDAETEVAEAAEVEELVEEMAEDGVDQGSAGGNGDGVAADGSEGA